MKTIILDNGHGQETAGKRSPIWPDGSQLFEWEFNRDIVRRIATMLEMKGIDYRILVPEDADISLDLRCTRANRICAEKGADNCILLSIHANAGGGTGWECYTTPGETGADRYATILAGEAEKILKPQGWKIRSDYSDGDPDKESDFYILKHTLCPAILTENLFMDTEKDCRYMMSEKGRQEIAEIHYNSILKF